LKICATLLGLADKNIFSNQYCGSHNTLMEIKIVPALAKKLYYKLHSRKIFLSWSNHYVCSLVLNEVAK